MALGIFGAVTGLAVASGPLIGGSLTEHISWQWIFWLNVPIGLVLLPLARLRLAESYAPNARLDIPGTLLVSGGLFGIVYGLVSANADGWTSPTVLTGLIAGTALIGGFVHHGFHAKNPMLPMRLFRNRGFFGINVASLLMFLGMFGSIFLLSQYLQGVARLLADRGRAADAALDRHADARRPDRRISLRPDRRPPGRRHRPRAPGRRARPCSPWSSRPTSRTPPSCPP